MKVKYKLNKKIKHLYLLILPLMIASCMYQRAPDIKQSGWKSIEVEFQIKENNEYIKRTWSIDDKQILNELSNSLQIKKAGDLWGLGTMTTNKITLELENNKIFTLYITDPDKLAMNEEPNPKTGFGLDITNAFYNKLKNIIESDIGEEISFYH